MEAGGAEVDGLVLILVLVAALLHACWNALVKVNADRLVGIALLAASAGLVSFAIIPWVAPPAAPSWPYLACSVLLHVGYNLFLIRAYAYGDLGQVYPLARGAAPLLVALVSVVFIGESLSLGGLTAVLLLALGVMSLAFKGGGALPTDPRAVGFALITSMFIAGYTVTDGLGARLSGSAHSYALWLFALDALPMTAIAIAFRRGSLLQTVERSWLPGLAGGAMSLGAYWIVIWALTQAPMALVAALRETSVVFAALIAVVWLNERFTGWRICATAAVGLGVVLLRF